MTAFNWAVLTACVWGVVPILEKVSIGKVTPYVGLFYRCIGVMLGMILLGAFLVKPQEFKSIDAKSLFFLIAAGFLANFVGQLLFFHGLKSGNISSFVPIAGSFPMVSFILGVVLLGEAVTPIKVGGVVMIIIGIWALKTG